MRIIVDASGNVLMWSSDGLPSAGAGQTAMDLTPQQQTALVVLMAQPNGGLTFINGTPAALPPVVPPPPPVLTTDQKLAAIGLTITDIQGAIVEAQTKSPVAIPDPNTAPIAGQATA